MPIIHLVRHGSNEYLKEHRLAGRQLGISLNANGLKQAQAVAKYFKDTEIKNIYSSPLERAKETATPTAKLLGLNVIEEAGLIETNIGEFEGQKIGDLVKEPEWEILQQTPSKFTFPGGESFAESQDRITSAIKNLCLNLVRKEQIICFSTRCYSWQRTCAITRRGKGRDDISDIPKGNDVSHWSYAGDETI